MDATGRPSQQLLNAQKELARRRRMASVNRPVCTAQFALRCADAASVFGEQLPVGREQLSVDEKNSPVPSSRFSTTGSALHVPNSQSQVRISPTLAAHCLNRRHRHNNAALDGPFRLYKVLGALDREGRGWLSSSDVEAALTKKESAAYIYGRRQLKSILRRGEGLFWQRVKSKGRVRIRLVSRAKVAQALGCGRLRGQEVEIPLSYLLGSGRGRQAAVNAALYTAVHAGHLRRDRARSGAEKARPISRAALQAIAGCSRFRQRSYERRMHIRVQANIHILGEHSIYKLERARLHQGLPAYKHVDYQGKINRHRRGAAYIAVRLPNSYQLPDDIRVVSSRRQRTINRFLDGLCHMGSGGSGRKKFERLYHRHAAAAYREAQRGQETAVYYPLSAKGGTQVWQRCGGKKGEGAGG